MPDELDPYRSTSPAFPNRHDDCSPWPPRALPKPPSPQCLVLPWRRGSVKRISPVGPGWWRLPRSSGRRCCGAPRPSPAEQAPAPPTCCSSCARPEPGPSASSRSSTAWSAHPGLRRRGPAAPFGAEIYVADLVGIAIVREMAAVMTAIVMAGRTGARAARHHAGERGDRRPEAFGISVMTSSVLPRIAGAGRDDAVALSLRMRGRPAWRPRVGMRRWTSRRLVSWGLQARCRRHAVRHRAHQELAFGALVALAGCHIGLRRGGAPPMSAAPRPERWWPDRRRHRPRRRSSPVCANVLGI